MSAKPLTQFWRSQTALLRPLVPFEPGLDRASRLDLSLSAGPSPSVFGDLDKFTAYIDGRFQGARYLAGGYGELRAIYASSSLFDAGVEPRRLHLGVDIWGAVGTPVYAPLPGRIHSLAFNDARGDYGATLILAHEGPCVWHTLYGHLSLDALSGRAPGDVFAAGDRLASFGPPAENGWWPPHLHFQVILDMQGFVGDYPGVCRASERDFYLANCPDPMPLLGFMRL